ncbi:Uncharacterized protein Adt_11410 [Abeliophyllum distichum]|uniref:Uncharacterized protein n=1 Tax=Abeliophyllum distichum TaxID=126358 RepID=A0ABD1UN29_9LAMI
MGGMCGGNHVKEQTLVEITAHFIVGLHSLICKRLWKEAPRFSWFGTCLFPNDMIKLADFRYPSGCRIELSATSVIKLTDYPIEPLVYLFLNFDLADVVYAILVKM